MIKTALLIVISIVFLTTAPSLAIGKAAKLLLYEKYQAELSTTTSAHDSIRILYNMFDLSARKGQLKHGWEILDLSERAGDMNAKTDMIRTLGTFYPSNDSVMNLLLRKTESLPNKESRASTKTYLLNQYFARKSRHVNNPELQKMLLDSITRSHDLKGDDIYDELSVIYQIIMFLGVDADGVLFRQSIKTYEELLERLPMSDYPLKSQFNTTDAMIHSRLDGDPRKAVEADLRMLDLIGMLEDMYQKQNRKYRNYDVNKFISYRRILSNYEALKPEEIELVHDSLLAICSRDEDVKATIIKDGHPSGFYYMAVRDYKKAVPILKTMFSSHYLSAYQRQKYYRMLMTASKNIGDQDTYIEAIEHYIKSTKEIDSIKTHSIRMEALLRDSILPTPLLRDVAEKQRHTAGQTSRNDIPLIIITGVLALLLITYMTLYIRLHLRISNR